MANALYNPYKQIMLTAGLNLTTLNIKCVLVDLADYTFSAAHDFLDDIIAAGRVATSPNLASKTVTNGVFDAADFVFSAVTGDQSEALVYYRDSGAAATSELMAFKDTGITGMPVTPNGGDINVTVDTGANSIFAL